MEGADTHLDTPLCVAKIVRIAEKNYLVVPGSEKIKFLDVIPSIPKDLEELARAMLHKEAGILGRK